MLVKSVLRLLHRLSAAALTAAILLAACDYVPQDPEHTTEEIRKTGILKIAVLENSPWVSDSDKPAGVEVQLAKGFARELDAKPRWYRMGEEEAFQALEAGQINLIIGGLHKSTPHKAGFTRPYYTVSYSIGWPAAGAGKLKDQAVAVRPGSWLAGKIKDKGGKPVESEEPFNTGYPVAAPDWKLVNHGYYPGITLHKAQHIMAVRQGENRFLVTLEKFLETRKADITSSLKEYGGS